TFTGGSALHEFGVISGSGGVAVTNDTTILRTLVLYGNNTYTGVTTTDPYTALNITNANALGGTGAGTIISGLSELGIGGDFTLNEPLTLSGQGIGGTGAIESANQAI